MGVSADRHAQRFDTPLALRLFPYPERNANWLPVSIARAM